MFEKVGIFRQYGVFRRFVGLERVSGIRILVGLGAGDGHRTWLGLRRLADMKHW